MRALKLYGFSLKHNVWLADLAKSNTEHLLNFECQTKNTFFSISMTHNLLHIFILKTLISHLSVIQRLVGIVFYLAIPQS